MLHTAQGIAQTLQALTAEEVQCGKKRKCSVARFESCPRNKVGAHLDKASP